MLTPAFGSVSLGSCASTDHSAEFVPIKIDASVSFPASRHTASNNAVPPTVKSWASRPAISDSSQLVLSLTEFIAEGRIGMTYTARVESASDASGNDISKALPSEVCVKVAKPTFARSLAREAWFYEQLGDCRGTSTASYYGFFTIPLSECKDSEGNAVTGIDLWGTPSEDSDMEDDMPSEDSDAGDDMPSEDSDMEGDMPSENCLIDDDAVDDFTDEHGFKTSSSWNAWCPSTDQPWLAILVLEKLGMPYYDKGREPAASVAKLRNELSEIIHDVASTGIIHYNITSSNILRAPQRSTEICPRHNYVHNWRLIDFDRSLRVDLENCDEQDIVAVNTQDEIVGIEYSFWPSGE